MIFTGMPYAFMMSQRLGRCSESKEFSKSMKLMTRGVCHSHDCSIMLRKMNICSVVLLPCRDPTCSALMNVVPRSTRNTCTNSGTEN